MLIPEPVETAMLADDRQEAVVSSQPTGQAGPPVTPKRRDGRSLPPA